MVFFLVTRGGRHVIDKYLASWGGDFFDHIRVRTYASLGARERFEPGTYVFADLERLTVAGRRAAGHLWERLARRAGDGEPIRLLNHPERSLRRHDLLKALHGRGTNEFDVTRVSEWQGRGRFPVFLRCESDHAGPRTPLLWDACEVDGALSRLRARDGGLADWIVVEFADCADDAGFYRKYSSFMLDGVLIPRHVFFSRSWMQKLADLRGGGWANEELAYVRDDPHAALLRPIFELAGIRYGRIDYSMGKRGIQVWEINTNPIILDPFDRDDEHRIEAHEVFAAGWDRALSALCARTAAAAERAISMERIMARAHVTAEALKETRPGRVLRRLKHRFTGRAAATRPSPSERIGPSGR